MGLLSFFRRRSAAAGAVAAGDAGDRLGGAPHQVLNGDRQGEDFAGPVTRFRHRLEQEAHGRNNFV